MGSTKYQGIMKVRQILLVRLMETQIWCLLDGSARAEFSKARIASVRKQKQKQKTCPFNPCLEARHFSSFPYVPDALFELLPQCWSSDPVSPNKSNYGPFKEQSLFCHLARFSSCFHSPRYGDFSFQHWIPGLETLVYAGTPCSLERTFKAEIFLLLFK